MIFRGNALQLLLVASLLLAALPHAQAQLAVVPVTLTIFVEDPGRAFIPGTNETVQVLMNYAPDQGGRPAPAPTLDRPENTTPTRITLAATTLPSWVTSVTFDPPEIFINMGPEKIGQRTFPARANAIITVADDAPALIRESFVVTATAEPNGNLAGATQDSPELKLRATTIGKLNVTAEPTVVIPGGRWVDIPFTIRNDGNSDIVAKINVTVRPENSQVKFDNTLELKRNETQTILVSLRTPWTAAEFGSLELEAVPIIDGEEGSIVRTEINVRGESAVPGPHAVSAMLATLAALALMRRQQR